MHYLTRKHLSRRMLLRGTGAALALPLLESMIPVGAAAAAAVPKPRLACIYIAHGAVMQQWTPRQEGRDFEFSPTLRSLAPFREHLNIISDLNLPAANVGDNSAGANHNRSSQCWLTCTPPGTGPTPTSLDQIVAQHIGQDTLLPSLELSLEDRTSISYLTPHTPLPMENNPRIVFERMFGTASTPEERMARQRQSASLLDTLTAEVAGLNRKLPASDKQRMERYLEDVREIERRLALAGSALPEGVEVSTKPVGVPDDFEDHGRMMYDLMALAWQAEITRVSSLLVARELGNRLFPKSGIAEPFHACSHHSENPEKIALFARMNEYHVRSNLAYFLDKLRNTPDGDGNLLDHSLVLYGSGMSNSNSHDHDPLPIVLAGKASGRLEGGRHIRAGRNTPLSNLMASVLDKLDVPVEDFADSTAPLNL